jgi:receptor-type tyrosine-protein phosphatase gamma
LLHCSAGIGRTGTVIALYNLQLTAIAMSNFVKQTGDIETVSRLSVFGVVRRLREQRFCMVQTTSQYEFIYEFIDAWLKE